MSKRCSRCQTTKPIEKFYAAHRVHCILCERETARWRMGRIENKVKIAFRDARRSAAKYNAEDTLTIEDLQYLFTLSGGRCAYTGRFMQKPSVEHLVPLSRGGSNSLWNVVIIEDSVNRAKRDWDVCNWLEKHRSLDVEWDLTALMAARRGCPFKEMADELLRVQTEANNEHFRKLMAKWKKADEGAAS